MIGLGWCFSGRDGVGGASTHLLGPGVWTRSPIVMTIRQSLSFPPSFFTSGDRILVFAGNNGKQNVRIYAGHSAVCNVFKVTSCGVLLSLLRVVSSSICSIPSSSRVVLFSLDIPLQYAQSCPDTLSLGTDGPPNVLLEKAAPPPHIPRHTRISEAHTVESGFRHHSKLLTFAEVVRGALDSSRNPQRAVAIWDIAWDG